MLIIEVVMLILFQPACFSSSGSEHLNIRKINSKFSQWCLFRSSQVVFVFPALSLFFFKDQDFLIKYPFIDGKSLHSFPSILLSGDSQEDTNGASSSTFFILLFFDVFNSSFVDHILSSFQMFFPYRCTS